MSTAKGSRAFAAIGRRHQMINGDLPVPPLVLALGIVVTLVAAAAALQELGLGMSRDGLIPAAPERCG